MATDLFTIDAHPVQGQIVSHETTGCGLATWQDNRVSRETRQVIQTCLMPDDASCRRDRGMFHVKHTRLNAEAIQPPQKEAKNR